MTRRSSRRRMAASALALVAILAVFLFRLVDIQVVHADALDAEAEDKRSIPQTILGVRGDIFDGTGVLLAHSVLRYDITASPKTAVKSAVTPQDAAERIGKITGQNPADIVAILADAVKANPDSDYAYVAKKVDAETFEQIRALDIPWIYYEAHPARTYPNGAVAGNLIGFVGSQNEAQAGLELSEDSCLAASDGREVYDSSADGVRIPGSTVVTQQAVDGRDLLLTIDSDLQWFTQQTLASYAQKFGAAWGTVVVQEVKTGKLVAVADYPTVDPNDVDATASTDVSSLGSRAFTAPFEPGSTFKTLTAASLLDAGLATPDTHVVAPYRYAPSGADVNDSEYHPTWNLTMTGVLKESSNTGMAQLGLFMPAQQRQDYMKKFGLGQRTEVGFGGEETGDLHGDPADWDAQTNLTTMFGQGLTTTAVQMASVYQTIGNGGVRMPVSLVSGCRAADGTVTDTPTGTGTRVISEQAARETVDMLENVATKGWLASQVRIPGYRVATKTGTAQHVDASGAYSKSYIVSLAGLAPAENPQYVVSVTLADPVKMNTSGAAAPIFREVMTQVLKQYSVVPSGSSSPDLATNY
ncbi:peptidoglycan D,D-transpeptidase FtsI family protein [Naasia aerilata]|uniref:Cell division protein FtsI n=1 Tax=Naasia aerilata TaxID=1162966 RepID=A0ABM8GG91_9MICO|nr:penicillin-binding protein 2 [Naasia aerilata]BDZ47360.1 cell division protein FtsI [Naasia aerilata]